MDNNSRFLECKNCKHKFVAFEHFVRISSLDNPEYFCEECFFDYSLQQLNATSVQNDYQGNLIEEDGNAKVPCQECCGSCEWFLPYKEPGTTEEQNLKILEHCSECATLKAFLHNN